MSSRRNEDNYLWYIKDIGLVIRWVKKQYGLQRADIELLLYLNQFRFFTRKQFKDGAMLYSWDKNRHLRLTKDGWISKTYEGNRRLGEHDKYTVSRDCVRMLRRIDRILRGKEDMPQSVRNKVWNGKSYSDKVMKNSIKNKYENGD